MDTATYYFSMHSPISIEGTGGVISCVSWGYCCYLPLIPMQGCEEALTEYIQENLLIVATIAITFVVAEVHIYAHVCA